MKTKFTKLIMAFAATLLIASCGNGNAPASSIDSYDSSWTPGENALRGAEQPLVKNPKGRINDLGRLRKSQSRNALPQSGEANILVVPVGFDIDANVGFKINADRLNYLQNAFFDGEGNTKTAPSVANFYNASSNEKLSLSGVVAPTVTMPLALTDYLVKSLTNGTSSVLKDVAEYIYNYLFVETETYYLPDFDSDDDGKVDAMVLAYSWPTALALYNSSYYSSISSFFVNDTFFGSEIGTDCPINAFTWTSCRMDDITGVTDDSHMYITEVGKMIGLSDYADNTGDGLGNYRAPLAYLDPMDGHIGDHNPFSKYLLGWNQTTNATPESVGEQGKQFTVDESNVLVLSPEETGVFGEYLMVEFYNPSGMCRPDSQYVYAYNLYGRNLPTKKGVRVYKVDSRLIKGISASSVSLTTSTPNFDEEIVTPSGLRRKAYYDFAFTNSGTNSYSNSGIAEDYPLVMELSRKGFNRHAVDENSALTNADIFIAGDNFGDSSSVDGFYRNFALDGSGHGETKLGLEFTVDSVSERNAKITVRRAA